MIFTLFATFFMQHWGKPYAFTSIPGNLAFVFGKVVMFMRVAALATTRKYFAVAKILN
jgi:hypothetical protein